FHGAGGGRVAASPESRVVAHAGVRRAYIVRPIRVTLVLCWDGSVRLLLDLWRRVRAAERGRDVSDATVVAVVGALVLAAGVPSLHVVGFGPDAGTWVHLVPLAAGCAVMLGKRRRPVLALLAGVLLFGVD